MNDSNRHEEITFLSWVEVRQRYYEFVLDFVRRNSPAYMDHEVITCECFERLRKYKDPVDHMGGFLMRIAKNLINDAGRELQKMRFVSLTDREGQAAYEVADSSPWKPEERERLAEETERFDLQYKIWREYLDELPEWQREIYELRRVNKLRFSEIGELLHLRVERVQVTFHLVAARVSRTVRRRYSVVLAARNDG